MNCLKGLCLSIHKGVSRFEELREMNNLIRKKQERIDELRSALTSTSMPLGERVQTSPTDKMSNLMCQIIVRENEVNSMIDSYADMKAHVKNRIFALDNEDWQEILCSHYVEFIPWREIAENKNLTLRAVYRKKDRALKRLKSITKDTKSC